MTYEEWNQILENNRNCLKSDCDGMNKLKPCPFCGGKAELLIVPGPASKWIVRCTKCYCNRGADISDHDAVERWNERTYEVTE